MKKHTKTVQSSTSMNALAALLPLIAQFFKNKNVEKMNFRHFSLINQLQRDGERERDFVSASDGLKSQCD